ncbi:MAG: hypothetical protein II173_08120 [Firmicutes bacterium]|nr:hypothetical protein [Bacillota bacterium]
MAEKKQHKLVAADGSAERKMKEAKPVGSAKGKRIGAVLLWLAAFAFELCAFFVLQGKINFSFASSMTQLIAFLVLDLVCVVIGSQLWKKANHIDPASEKNKLKFWLWNNLGLIASIVCFLPIIILLLTNKDLDKKTKTIATVVAIIALLIGGASSIDYNPVSAEDQAAAITALGDETVYWAPFGKVYHTHEDCQALNVSDSLTYGSVEQAIAANRTRLCSFCARRDNITGVKTDGK